jgi:hypothetical protein
MKIKIVLGYFTLLYDECYLQDIGFVSSFTFGHRSKSIFDTKFILENNIYQEYAFVSKGKILINKLTFNKYNDSSNFYYIL